MTAFRKGRNTLAAIILGVLLLGAGCGGTDGGLFDGLNLPSFWAFDFASNADYRISAQEVGSGLHCRIYVEAGRTVSPAAIDNIIRTFDFVIYPSVVAAFGNPPNPDIDNDARVTLLLLGIRDAVSADGGVTAGYFSPVNEFTQDEIAAAGFIDKTNQREMIYLNIGPGAPRPASALAYRVIAHELQHVIHWAQKDQRLTPRAQLLTASVSDDTWLNEAMSESAPFFCGFGPDTGRSDYYAQNPTASLTAWGGNLASYAAVYMWSSYIYDRSDLYDRTLFRQILLDNTTGATSVDRVLGAQPFPNTFSGLFVDWTSANISATDNAIQAIPGIPWEWHYNAPPSLAAIFNSADRVNPVTTPSLRQWAADYYQFRRFSPPFAGTMTWFPGSGQDSASFLRPIDNTFDPSITAGLAYPYTDTAYLVVRNASGADNVSTAGGTFTTTPSVVLGALIRMPSPDARPAGLAPSGGPYLKCGLDHFTRKDNANRPRGKRVLF